MKDISDLNPRNFPADDKIKKNLELLFSRVMEFQESYKKTLTITSGLRSEALQEQLIKDGKSNAVHSKHCMGLAADVFDPKNEIKEFILSDPRILDVIGLWCEDFSYSPDWVHFQVVAPASGKRFFIP